MLAAAASPDAGAVVGAPDPPNPPSAGAAGPGAAAQPAARSSGCSKPARTGAFALTATDGNKTLRSYLLQVPADYQVSRPYALVFVFHAAGGNAEQSRSWGLQNAVGAAAGALFVFPTGIPFQREGIGWDDRSTGYDLPFFDHMLADLEASYCLDTGRIFVAGFSWGGDFATALACNRGDVIRAVAVNSTTDEYRDKADYRTYNDLPCPTHRHPPVRFEHAVDGDSEYPPPYFATTSKLFQFLNACSAATTPAPSSTAVMSCGSFTGCKSPLIECAFEHRLGHVLPPNWAQDTWDFFAAQ
jgi:pimeloyl-ACP methyl ester carboxylesterase